MMSKEEFGRLRVGMTIESNIDGMGTGSVYVGEIAYIEHDHIGTIRFDKKTGSGINGAWKAYPMDAPSMGYIRVVQGAASKQPTINPMTNPITFLRELAATREEKLLKEFGIEDPIGTPTKSGLELSAEISYKANRKEIIELVKKMDEERRKKEE